MCVTTTWFTYDAKNEDGNTGNKLVFDRDVIIEIGNPNRNNSQIKISEKCLGESGIILILLSFE